MQEITTLKKNKQNPKEKELNWENPRVILRDEKKKEAIIKSEKRDG